MIYRIYSDKRHEVVKDGDLPIEGNGMRYVEADADGWIPWEGGECPLPSDAGLEVEFRDGDIEGGRAGDFKTCWSHDHMDEDIIAYRPILDAKPEAPEWDGGLPPVGLECEARNYHYGQAFEAAKIVHRTRKDVILVEYASGDAGFLTAPADFRPIRSEEDRQIEEMQRVYMKGEDAGGHQGGLRALHRAGYRKQ